jgi:hypothetical protein
VYCFDGRILSCGVLAKTNTYTNTTTYSITQFVQPLPCTTLSVVVVAHVNELAESYQTGNNIDFQLVDDDDPRDR